MLIPFIIFGLLGWGMEIIWTGFNSLIKKDFRLVSQTSIWMFFIYGLAAFLGPICDIIMIFPIILRGVIYVVCIFSIEFIIGSFMKKFNICPWDYSSSKYNINGIIRLDYAPVWFLAGIIFEYVHFMLQH